MFPPLGLRPHHSSWGLCGPVPPAAPRARVRVQVPEGGFGSSREEAGFVSSILDSALGVEQKQQKEHQWICHFVTFLRDPESQADDDSQEVFKLAKDVLIQGLTDENPGLQYVPLLQQLGWVGILRGSRSWPAWGLSEVLEAHLQYQRFLCLLLP